MQHRQDQCITLDGIEIVFDIHGEGSPLLLLHGFPQTRAMWRPLLPHLAPGFTIITADLRGYGASSKPGQDRPEECSAYSFRAMGADLLALMTALGHRRFHLAGHDRGARVAHRMALDAPERVTSLALMDIVPTHLLLSTLTHDVAKTYYHWFFLAQPHPLPERLISADPDLFFTGCLAGWGGKGLVEFAPDQLAAYRASWRDPATIFGMCQDYRAAIAHDMADDAVDLHRRITCPALVLYGADGAMARAYDAPATWADRLTNMQAQALPGGHFFPDTAPEATARALAGFVTALSP